ncbi:hypothetical protein I79_022790 [Cricetulus griseus]|uniref:Uncharacterized protein n=1 Tax=Cricetulus griseus TaxID=10029 RepID=G3IGA7_CRIGR|nr:hypothetical protein I79_022790 [Cricetulus griseus]
MSPQILPTEFMVPHGREGRKSVRAREDGGYQENKALKISMGKAHMNSQTLRQHAKGVQGSAPSPVASSLVFLWDP